MTTMKMNKKRPSSSSSSSLMLLLLLFSILSMPEFVSSTSNNLNGDETTTLGVVDENTPVAVDDSSNQAASSVATAPMVNLITLGSDPEYLVAWNNHVVFAADDGIHGKELWITTGSSPNSGGARLLADIRPGFSHSNPSHLIAFENSGGVFFAADNGVDGNELFKTDGTTFGTMLWADVNPGPASSNPSDFAIIPGNSTLGGDDDSSLPSLFFAANDGLYGNEPWILPHDAPRTPKLLRDISPDGSSNPGGPPCWFRNALYFAADNIANGVELWRTTGRADTDTSTGSTELWSDIRSSHGSSNPSDFYVYQDQLYFCARGGGAGGMGDAGRELYVNDGTRLGTKLVRDINQQTSASGGGGASASAATTVGEAASSSRPSDFCEFQGLLFFAATDGVHGRELFVTDGTEQGTRLFADIRSGPASSNPTGLVVFDNKLYFAANDGISGTELWVIQNARPDNAHDDAKLFADIFPGPTSSNPAWFVVHQPPVVVPAEQQEQQQQQQPAAIMMFAANDGVNGRELWAVTAAKDDQPAKAMMWADINQREPSYRARSDAVAMTAFSWWIPLSLAATCTLGALMSVF
jgi:ELWxxDGT repeat protein